MSSDDDHFPATPTTSGWYPVGDGTDQETYWDGTAWTRRRQYRFGSPFLEIPLHRSDPPLPPTPLAPTSSAPDAPSSFPTSTTPESLVGNDASLGPERNPTPPSRAPSTSPSSRFRLTRQRIRLIQLIYLIAIIGFFVSAHGGKSFRPEPRKFFVFSFFLGLAAQLVMWVSSAGARQEVRLQESSRRPRWPFRYLSRLTDGLQGQRLTSFIGGIRTQPRLGPTGLNATVPMVRLSIFSNGIRVGSEFALLFHVRPHLGSEVRRTRRHPGHWEGSRRDDRDPLSKVEVARVGDLLDLESSKHLHHP